MAFLGKEYTLVGQENFDGFLRSAGLTDDKIEAMQSFKSRQKYVLNGDTYTFFNTDLTGSKEKNFKNGQEIDDVLGANKAPVKIRYVVDGNTVTETVKAANGTATFKKEFNGDDLVVTITSDNWDGVAKRFYKA